VFFSGVGLTAVATGLTIASAVDTRAARNDFNLHPTAQALSDGKAKELRTNVLLAVSGGLAVLTAVTGLWLVQWHGSASSGRVGLLASGGFIAGSPSGAVLATGSF